MSKKIITNKKKLKLKKSKISNQSSMKKFKNCKPNNKNFNKKLRKIINMVKNLCNKLRMNLNDLNPGTVDHSHTDKKLYLCPVNTINKNHQNHTHNKPKKISLKSRILPLKSYIKKSQ